jgi:hypothetical protein
LVKAVEQYKGVGASVVETLGHMGHGTEEWGQLDGNWNLQAGLYLAHEFAIAVLDGVAAFVWVSFHRVEVKLDGVSAGLLHLAGVANPAAGRRTVQAGDNGNRDGLFCPMNQLSRYPSGPVL